MKTKKLMRNKHADKQSSATSVIFRQAVMVFGAEVKVKRFAFNIKCSCCNQIMHTNNNGKKLHEKFSRAIMVLCGTDSFEMQQRRVMCPTDQNTQIPTKIPEVLWLGSERRKENRFVWLIKKHQPNEREFFSIFLHSSNKTPPKIVDTVHIKQGNINHLGHYIISWISSFLMFVCVGSFVLSNYAHFFMVSLAFAHSFALFRMAFLQWKS